MKDTPYGGVDRAECGMAGTGVTDDFATVSILLRGEGEGDEVGGLECGGCSSREVEVSAAGSKLKVGEEKGGCFGGRGGVFARSEEEEEGKYDHVGNGDGAGMR